MQPGTDWGGIYSRWSFDESKGYVMLAKEMQGPAGQSVPLLDDEMNTQAEIQLTLMRRMVKRIHGNGTDNSGFKIVASGSNPSNNFTIKGGDGTVAGAGYIFVDGWMPFLLNDKEYTSQAGAAAITTPTSARTDLVFIDVHLDEIDGTEDSNLVDSSVGFETSRRLRLVWAVGVQLGSTVVPANYTDVNNRYHWVHGLATIARTANSSQITDAMITDIRNRGRMPKRGEYFHIQSAASSLWTINHNLGRSSGMQVTVYVGYDMVDAPVHIVDTNTITIDFGGIAVSGWAVCQQTTSY